jgi:hypothetical protein
VGHESEHRRLFVVFFIFSKADKNAKLNWCLWTEQKPRVDLIYDLFEI